MPRVPKDLSQTTHSKLELQLLLRLERVGKLLLLFACITLSQPLSEYINLSASAMPEDPNDMEELASFEFFEDDLPNFYWVAAVLSFVGVLCIVYVKKTRQSP